MTWTRHFYRALLLLYPRGFRDAHGDEAARVFADACADSWARGEAGGVLRRLFRAMIDVPASGIAERLGRHAGPRGSTEGRPGLFADLGGDLRHALRACWQRPGLSLAIVITLALGIGANPAIFSVVDATLLAHCPTRTPRGSSTSRRAGTARDRPATRPPTSSRTSRHVCSRYPGSKHARGVRSC